MGAGLKVSVITVCLNAGPWIKGAMESVFAQRYKNIEYIVVDGQSTDETLPIVRVYQGKIAKIISEQDHGVYDAMNKGIQAATGDILYFLNADDLLYDEHVVQKIVDAFEAKPNVDVLIGTLSLVNLSPGTDLNYDTPFVKKVFNRRDFLKNGMCHQRIFARKKVFDQIGVFDAQYSICADYQWFLKCLSKGIAFENMDLVIAAYNHQGISSRHASQIIKEKSAILLKDASLLDFLYYGSMAVLKKFIKV